MKRRIQNVLLVGAALAALALGGAQVANAVSGSGTSTHGAKTTKHLAKHHRSHTRARSAAEPADSERGQEQPGAEVPGNDGPGGHADEPGNPGADHQFQGEE
jgi:hypothetical protein